MPPLTNRANYIHWLQDLLGLSAPKGGWWVGSTILLAVAGVMPGIQAGPRPRMPGCQCSYAAPLTPPHAIPHLPQARWWAWTLGVGPI